MKKIALCLLLSQLLACTAVKSPTPDKLPETPQAALTQFPNQDEYYKNQIVEPINKIVAYFDEDGNLMEDSSKARYYRVHLGNTKNGDVVVQNFYADTKTKSSSIGQIDKADLLNLKWVKSIRNPFTHSYSKKGKLINLTLYKKGLITQRVKYKNQQSFLSLHLQYDDKERVVKSKILRPNGQLWAETEGSCIDFPETKTYIYDENQVKWLEQNAICGQDDKSTFTFYHENGQKMIYFTMGEVQEILFPKLFDENGQEIFTLPATEVKKLMEKFVFRFGELNEWTQMLIKSNTKLENDEE